MTTLCSQSTPPPSPSAGRAGQSERVPRALPILFNGAMVRATLDGRKTQTRRVVKPQPPHGYDRLAPESPIRMTDRFGHRWENDAPPLGMHTVWCPYGQPGDRLWVRETIRDEGECAVYSADGEVCSGIDTWVWQRKVLPSIHMPRGASRITLEVAGVRVERLQEISVADAIAEGLQLGCKDGRITKHGLPEDEWSNWRMSPVDYLQDRWSQEGAVLDWASNPWVWVVEFKRLTPEPRDE